MEKRIQSINNEIVIGVIIEIDAKEQEKFESMDHRKQIEQLAKNFNVDWAVEISEGPVVFISRTFGVITDSNEVHQLDVDATNFMNAVDKLKLNKHNEDYDFIKRIVNEWDETEERLPTVGFVVMAESIPGTVFPYDIIGERLAKELCLSYLKLHSND